MNPHLEKFGERIGEQALVVQAYFKDTYETAEQILSLPWLPDLRSRMEQEQEPFLLVIREDFRAFDPSVHPWGILWFGDYWDDPDAIWRVLDTLTRKLRSGEDLFAYFQHLREAPDTKALIKSSANQGHGFQIHNKAVVDGSVRTFVRRIQEAVAGSHTRTALDLLTSLDDPSLLRDALLFQSRWERLQRESVQGTISASDVEVRTNALHRDILNRIEPLL
ncbi:MAG: hypothetical protein IPH16_21505 [Haliscomenobacter sp.]|nr:hypothetical protein [Haliscomenobacter sp.]